VWTAVEKGKELSCGIAGVMVGLDASIRSCQIGFLEHVCLLLILLGREDEMLRHDGELVQDEVVGRRNVCNEEGPLLWRFEGIERLPGRLGLWCCWLAGEGRGEAQLELKRASAAAEMVEGETVVLGWSRKR
jgi:hypothetical protein